MSANRDSKGRFTAGGGRGGAKFTVVGLEAALSKLAGYSDKVKDKLKEAVQKHTENIASQARTDVVVDTGRLKSEIETDYSTGGFFGRARAKTPYAHIVELGTATHPAKPFLHPAFEATKPKFVANVKQIITE